MLSNSSARAARSGSQCLVDLEDRHLVVRSARHQQAVDDADRAGLHESPQLGKDFPVEPVPRELDDDDLDDDDVEGSIEPLSGAHQARMGNNRRWLRIRRRDI